MMIRKLWIYLLLFAAGPATTELYAQDPHFSQYFSSPLSFNPAFTGYFEGTGRLAGNIRNQWANISDPYTTGTLSFDTRILQDRIGSNDKLGMGIFALYDQSAGGIFKNNYVALSTAFNKGLDAEGLQSIGIGVQVCLARNSVDFSRISYSNQFAGNGYDLSVPSGETISNNSISYTDLNAGLLYNFRTENDNQFSVGVGLYHILQPSLSYFSATNPNLPRRLTMHIGANLNVATRDQFFFSGHLMYQGGANETVLGAAYGFGLGDSDNYLYAGGWFRSKDAVYPYLGLRTASFQLGLSYDITISDLRQTKGYSGSSELSFIYFFNRSSTKGIPCFF